MMTFSAKLSFLMHITEVSNKELAAELSVDPSLISLMRSGKRKLSRNPEQAKRMAAFFAKRCTAPYQRQALSEMLGQTSISANMPAGQLALRLEIWLKGEQPITEILLSGIRQIPVPTDDVSIAPPAPNPVMEPQTLFFFGEEGRRESIRRIIQTSLAMENPGTMLTVVDDNLEWLLSDYSMTKKSQAWLLELADRGFSFLQIMPPANYINRYAESLQFWLPVYSTGQASVYYYPRLRGNLYRHSMVVIPGCCVQYAASVAMGGASDITLFSTDPTLIGAFEKQFREHISLCRPALNVYREPTGAFPCYRDYFKSRGESVQWVNAPSFCSMPRTLLERSIQETEAESWRATFRFFLDAIPDFERKLEQTSFIDICRLFTAEQIRGGSMRVGFISMAYSGQPIYTPETYCLHLKNILRLMDTYENYVFLPMDEEEHTDYDLYVNEDGLALIAHTASPLITLEIRRQTMVIAFREYLLRKAETVGYDRATREKTRKVLRSLIQELGG